MSKMTARKVATVKEPGYHRDDGDGGARGLYLQVTERANSEGVTRSWVYRYVSPVSGKPRWMGLGPADVVSLAEARERAVAARKAVKLGRDPIDEREAERTQVRLEAARRVTFGKCGDEYLAAHEASWGNEKHREQWRSSLKIDAALLTDLPVSEIDTALVLKVLRPIWYAKPETASRLRGRIERVLAFATVSEYRQGENPARWLGHLKEMLPKVSDVHDKEPHPALPYERASEFMADLRSREGIAARALELAILTGLRSAEVREAKWSEIKFTDKAWEVPAERMKMKIAHRVPLSARALAILKNLPQEGKYVFPGAKPNEPISEKGLPSVIRRMNRDAKQHGRPLYIDPKENDRKVVPHGFRSTFSDWAAEFTSFPEHLVEMALAHVVKGVKGDYRRGDLFEKRRKLMEAWAGYCNERPRASGDNVTPIRARA
jgi:integrase